MNSPPGWADGVHDVLVDELRRWRAGVPDDAPPVAQGVPTSQRPRNDPEYERWWAHQMRKATRPRRHK